MIVRWVDSVEAVPAGLWDECFPPPVEGAWWYRALERSGLGGQFTFLYGIIERDGRPIGIAPAFVMDVPLDVIAPESLAALIRFAGRVIGFLRFQRTLFIGSPCADEGTIGLVAGVATADVAAAIAAAALAKSRQVGAAMTVFKDFTAGDGPALGGLPGFFRVESFPGTRLPLAGSFDGYLKWLNSGRRYKLKKKLADGRARCPTQAEVIRHPSPALLDELFGLFWQTYEKGETKFEKLNRAFFDRIAAEGPSRWIVLRSTVDGRPVAFMLCFDCRPRAIDKFIGIDYSIDGAFLYFQLWAAAIEWASAEGLTEMQSGQTAYRAKLDLGNTPVPLVNFARHRNRIVHAVFARQARSISWATIDPALATHAAAPK